MTVLSRGARVRRGGRRPGWLLLTALLVLAIGASSALVFTNRVELLKLAVILALWAAVVAAFVSVIYRRQSDVDQARVRDLKLVYDLQLDREISARREYELTVESQLRRELASELRAQAADEVAALRSELAALRTNLEILFETELDQRPALETESAAARGYSEWSDSDRAAADWVSSNRVTSVRAETGSDASQETSIIDVPEEPVPRQPVVDAANPYPAAHAYQPAEDVQRAEAFPTTDAAPVAEDYRGSHWRPAEPDIRTGMPEQSESRHLRQPSEAPPPPPETHRPDWYRPPPADAGPGGMPPEWQPVGADGRWAPGGVPTGGSAPSDENDFADRSPAANGGPSAQPEPEVPSPRRSRHAGPVENDPETGPVDSAAQQGDPSRHSAERSEFEGDVGLAPPPPPEPVARHRSVEPASDDQGPPTGGQSVADLLARLQAEPIGGGRRRRRAD